MAVIAVVDLHPVDVSGEFAVGVRVPVMHLGSVIDADVGRLIYRENRRMSAFE
ncbi:MAG: hypothetical protein JWN05_433 [Arthrobacter sp.]|nr:hypothetical protein [Arthrobacter sp.]